MSLWVSAGGGLAEVKDLFVSAGGGNQKLAKVYESNGSGLSEIWSGMGKKWIYMIKGATFNNGYLTRIDPDTMVTVDIQMFGDLGDVGRGSYGLADRDYDHHGNIFFTLKDKDKNNSWVYRNVRMNRHGVVVNDPAVGFVSMDKNTLEVYNYYVKSSYSYLDILGTSDYGNSYYLKATVPAVLSTSGYNRYGYAPFGEVISTQNYLFYLTADPGYLEGDLISHEYRGVARYNRHDFKHTILLDNDSRAPRGIDYMPLLAHPTRIDHFYSTNLTNDKRLYRSNWLQLRDPNGTEIAALCLPQLPSSIRLTEDRLIAICGYEIIEIQKDLAYYRTLVAKPASGYLYPAYLDDEFYIRSPATVYDGAGTKIGFSVEVYDYTGKQIGYGVSVRGGDPFCNHPLLEP